MHVLEDLKLPYALTSKTDTMIVFVISIHTKERLYGMILAFCFNNFKLFHYITLKLYRATQL
jgi:hypothetical protein